MPVLAAGVIPIDRLTDVRAPAEVIAQRIPRPALEAAYGTRLPRPGPEEDPARCHTTSLLVDNILNCWDTCSHLHPAANQQSVEPSRADAAVNLTSYPGMRARNDAAFAPV